VLRAQVSEEGTSALPAIDVDAAVLVVGSAPDAHVRLPAHPDVPARDSIARDAVGDGITRTYGPYRVHIAPAPAGTRPTPPQRTESLARELARSLLGTGSAPSLEVERGPHAGARRSLAAPESALVIGRGDDAGWIILDEDLSRTHAEIRRGWDGTRLLDLGSLNGTKIDGVAVGQGGAALHDGALVELGHLALRFRDPAEAHLRPAPARAIAEQPSPPAKSTVSPTSDAPVSVLPFYLAMSLLVIALTGLVWILSFA
jgi:hypothetical protein